MNNEKNDKVTDVSHLNEMICFCFGVSRDAIVQAVLDNNVKGIEQITKYTHAGGGCRGCQPDIRRIIDETRQQNQMDQKEKNQWAKKQQGPDTIPLIKKVRIVEAIVQEQQSSYFSRLGVNVGLVDISSEQVLVSFESEAADSRENEGVWVEQLQSAIKSQLAGMVVVVKDRRGVNQ